PIPERYFTTIGPETYLARDHTLDLVFAGVDVRRNQDSWVKCVLDDRNSASFGCGELDRRCKARDQGDLAAVGLDHGETSGRCCEHDNLLHFRESLLYRHLSSSS